jgi:hypothetical protein
MGKATKAQSIRMAIARGLGQPVPDGLVPAPEDERLYVKTCEDVKRLLDLVRRMATARDPQTISESYVSAQRVMNELYKALDQNLS